MTTSEWLLHFATFLWYITGAHLTVPEVVCAFQSTIKTAVPEVSEDFSAPALTSSSISNLAIHILKFHATHGYPIHKMLCPKTSNPDYLDYKFTWFLVMTFEALGYTIRPELFESISTGFAAQLERMGRWDWAIVVLKYLPANEPRRVMIKRIILASLNVREINAEYWRKVELLGEAGVHLSDLVR
jgi:hypothetical protein